MKKILIMGLCLLSLVSITGCGKKENGEKDKTDSDIVNKDEKKINTSEGIVQEKTIDGFKFDGTTLVTTGEETSFITYMTNTNKVDININEVEVSMKNATGEEVIKFNINLYQVLASDQTIELSSMISEDLTNVKTIDYSIKKADN